jgi:hypothetical protein
MFNIRQANLNNLNSMTKYPSIPTYHKIGDKGVLQMELEVDFASDEVLVSEKVDGTNARIILCPDGSVLLGSREDLLWAKGDLIGNPSMGIVPGLKELAQKLSIDSVAFMGATATSFVWVLFGEFYGAGVGAASKNYSKNKNGFRLFDAIHIPDFERVLEMPRERISSWRERGGQAFAGPTEIKSIAASVAVETVPPVAVLPDGLGITDIHETYTWLQQFKKSSAALDGTGLAQSEGVVVRTWDRKKIAKIRFEDYERTLRRLGGTK